MNPALSAIRHVVVLMFENRSFDHIMGALPGVNGMLGPDGAVNPEYYNLPDPTQPPSAANPKVLPMEVDASFQLPHDFNHDFGDGMMPDRFGPGTSGYLQAKGPIGAPAQTYPETNSGFYSTIAFNVNCECGTPGCHPIGTDGRCHPNNGKTALSYFRADSLKVLHKLAREFVLCDNWHCDMPGHTLPNRAFTHCATTGDAGIDDSDSGMVNRPTIFEMIEQHGQTWKMYAPGCGQVDTRFLNAKVFGSPNTNIPIEQFAQDAEAGILPFYSFLMCWMANTTVDTDTSMHPNSQIEPGENYLAAVYNTLRNSPGWENTLLVVTFDENGGMYDHVTPVPATPPTPGQVAYGRNGYGKPTEFDFSLAGFRIPAIVISPWLRSGVMQTQLQNTSILRFLEDTLAPGENLALTQRDLSAPSLALVLDQFGLTTPRTDCPAWVDTYAGFPFADGKLDYPCTLQNADRPPLPHMVEITMEYSAGLPGHADSGKSVHRDFTTNADLERYSQQRDHAAQWHYEGVHLAATLDVKEETPGQWMWELQDPNGAVLRPDQRFCTREEALEALDRVRFLFHELCSRP